MMEIYKEITVLEVFDYILKDDYKELYYKNKDSSALFPAEKEQWRFKDFKSYKWFKREVIGIEDKPQIC